MSLHIFDIYYHFPTQCTKLIRICEGRVYWSTNRKLCYETKTFHRLQMNQLINSHIVFMTRTSSMGMLMITVLLWILLSRTFHMIMREEHQAVVEEFERNFPGKIVLPILLLLLLYVYLDVNCANAKCTPKLYHLHDSWREGKSKSLENDFDTRTYVYLCAIQIQRDSYR